MRHDNPRAADQRMRCNESYLYRWGNMLPFHILQLGGNIHIRLQYSYGSAPTV